MYFDLDAPAGQRGGEGCVIILLEPPRRLGFTWNFPPSIPGLRQSGAHTHVVVELAQLSGTGTRVTLRATGWGEGEDWAQGYAYFERAWALVLDRLRRRFESGPLDWANPDG